MIPATNQVKPFEYTVLPIDQILAKTRAENNSTVEGCDVLTHLYCTCKVLRAIKVLWGDYPRGRLITESAEWLAALHDIGKVTPAFQDKISKELPRNPLWKGMHPGEKSNHAEDSQVILSKMRDKFGNDFAEMAGAHHGDGFSKGKVAIEENLGREEWDRVRNEVIEKIKRLLDLPECDLKNIPKEYKDIITGEVILADWISSSMDIPHGSPLPDDDAFLHAVTDAGFEPYHLNTSLSFSDIFPFSPNQLQAIASDKIFQGCVCVIESGMGSGKTEAALYSAFKLLKDKSANGIYFAMPTCLTSQKIWARLNDFLEQVLEEDGKKGAILIHGNAWLEWRLQIPPENESSSIQNPDSWFQSRKRALLAPFGAGTVDQALLSVINCRHSTLRSFALAGKVVILDEVHSYDAYTSQLICDLVKNLRNHGATVIILSATLTKKALLNFIGVPDGDLRTDAYPRITIYDGSDIQEYPVDKGKPVEVKICKTSKDCEVMGEVLERAGKGEQVLWIENTVGAAQNLYCQLVAVCPHNVEIGLIHSRFPSLERLDKESYWVDLLGKSPKAMSERKKHGRILVATQILEQSVDVDADFLVTRLAPADMLFQRIGRLWRHACLDSIRPQSAERQAVILYSEHYLQPEELQKNPLDYLPYDPYWMCRTFDALLSKDMLVIPDDIRPVLESIYEERNEENKAINTMKFSQQQNREKLERLALLAGGISYGTQSDDTHETITGTRYSELEDVQVLLLKKGNCGYPLEQKLCTVFGKDIDLPDMNAEHSEKMKAAIELNKVLIHVPEYNAPEYAEFPTENFLRHIVWTGLGDDRPIRAAYVDDDGTLLTLSCNIAGHDNRKLSYHNKLGYKAGKD